MMGMKYKPLVLPACAGIYAITHVATGRRYIGSARRILYRCGKHRSQLRHNSHFSHHLQNAWNKYGEEAFTFEVLETCLDSHVILLAREQHWIDSRTGEIFNSRLVAESTEGCKLNLSDEERERRSRVAKATFSRCPRPPQTNFKLTADAIPSIFVRYASGETLKAISVSFGLMTSTVIDVLRRTTWSEVEVSRELIDACKPRLGRMGRKLDDDQVREIRRRVAFGESCARIAQDYPVSSPVILEIKHKKKYASVI